MFQSVKWRVDHIFLFQVSAPFKNSTTLGTILQTFVVVSNSPFHSSSFLANSPNLIKVFCHREIQINVICIEKHHFPPQNPFRHSLFCRSLSFRGEKRRVRQGKLKKKNWMRLNSFPFCRSTLCVIEVFEDSRKFFLLARRWFDAIESAHRRVPLITILRVSSTRRLEMVRVAPWRSTTYLSNKARTSSLASPHRVTFISHSNQFRWWDDAIYHDSWPLDRLIDKLILTNVGRLVRRSRRVNWKVSREFMALARRSIAKVSGD